jgi:hypothetical protein
MNGTDNVRMKEEVRLVRLSISAPVHPAAYLIYWRIVSEAR